MVVVSCSEKALSTASAAHVVTALHRKVRYTVGTVVTEEILLLHGLPFLDALLLSYF